jgi:hypothetical protein
MRPVTAIEPRVALSRRSANFHQMVAGELCAAAVLFEIILHQIIV